MDGWTDGWWTDGCMDGCQERNDKVGLLVRDSQCKLNENNAKQPLAFMTADAHSFEGSLLLFVHHNV